MLEPSSRTIAIIDDHRLFTDTLAVALRDDDTEVIGFDPTSPSWLDEILVARPDLVMLDLGFGGNPKAGLPFVGHLSRAGLRVLVVTGNPDRLDHAECLTAGAVGVLDKAMTLERLIEALGKALRGEPVMAHAEQQRLIMELDRARRERHSRPIGFTELTNRERLVLGHLVEGHQAGMIARSCKMSVSTVRTHIRSILIKLGVHSQLEAVALAVHEGWSDS